MGGWGSVGVKSKFCLTYREVAKQAAAQGRALATSVAWRFDSSPPDFDNPGPCSAVLLRRNLPVRSVADRSKVTGDFEGDAMRLKIDISERAAAAIDKLASAFGGINQLESLHEKVDRVLAQQEIIMADLTALTAEVERNTAVDQSAIALLTGLAAQIEALKTDPVALQGLADKLKGSSNDLAAAVLANTPAEPTE